MSIKFSTLIKKNKITCTNTVQEPINSFQNQILTKKPNLSIDQKKINFKDNQKNKNRQLIIPPMLHYYSTQLYKRFQLNVFNRLKKNYKNILHRKVNKFNSKNKKSNSFLYSKIYYKKLKNQKKKINLHLKKQIPKIRSLTKKSKKSNTFKNTNFRNRYITKLIFPKIKKLRFFNLLNKITFKTLSKKRKQQILINKVYIYSNFKPLSFNLSQQWNSRIQLLLKQPILSLIKKKVYRPFVYFNVLLRKKTMKHKNIPPSKKNTYQKISQWSVTNLFPIKQISSVSITTPFLTKKRHLENKIQNYRIHNLENREKIFVFLYKKKYFDNFSTTTTKSQTYTQYRTSFNLPNTKETLKKYLYFRDQFWKNSLKLLEKLEQKRSYNSFRKLQQRKIKQTAKIIEKRIKKKKLKILREHPLFLKRTDWNFINRKSKNKKLKQNKNRNVFLRNKKRIITKLSLKETFTKKVHKINSQQSKKNYQIIRVFAGRNNTILTLSNRWGQKNITFSTREMGFTGGQNRIPLTSQELGYQFALLLKKILKISHIYLIFQGPGKKRKQLIRGLTRTKLLWIRKIFIKTKIQHNGCRKPKKRRK